MIIYSVGWKNSLVGSTIIRTLTAKKYPGNVIDINQTNSIVDELLIKHMHKALPVKQHIALFLTLDKKQPVVKIATDKSGGITWAIPPSAR